MSGENLLIGCRDVIQSLNRTSVSMLPGWSPSSCLWEVRADVTWQRGDITCFSILSKSAIQLMSRNTRTHMQ